MTHARTETARARQARACLVAVWSGLLATFVIAPGLFLANPPIGCVSVFGDGPILAPPYDMIVFGGLVAGLVPIPFLRRPTRWVRVWCAAAALRCGLDLMTWQPFLLMYVAFLWALSFVRWGERERDEGTTLHALRIGMVGIYAWSGFAKLHVPFFTIAGPTMLDPAFGLVGMAPTPTWICAAAAVFELVIGLGLLWPRSRRAAVVGLIAMHTYLLVVLGPLAKNDNAIVWPWNVVMVALLVVLFWNDRSRPAALLRPARGVVRVVTIFLFVVAPGLSYLGAWPPYLSFRLYALRYPRGYVLLEDATIERLPPEIRAHVERQDNLATFAGLIRIHFWAEKTVGAFAPGHERLYEKITRRFAGWARHPHDVALLIERPPTWPWESERVQVGPRTLDRLE